MSNLSRSYIRHFNTNLDILFESTSRKSNRLYKVEKIHEKMNRFQFIPHLRHTPYILEEGVFLKY